jgi:hypothetical protein
MYTLLSIVAISACSLIVWRKTRKLTVVLIRVAKNLNKDGKIVSVHQYLNGDYLVKAFRDENGTMVVEKLVGTRSKVWASITVYKIIKEIE